MFRSGRRPLVLFGSVSQTSSLEDQNVHLQRERALPKEVKPVGRHYLIHLSQALQSRDPFPRREGADSCVFSREEWADCRYLHHNRSTFLLLPFFPWVSSLILTQHNRANHLQTNFSLLLYRHKVEEPHFLYVCLISISPSVLCTLFGFWESFPSVSFFPHSYTINDFT